MKESFEKEIECQLRKLHPDDWEKLRDIRLRAVKDSPQAFGDTVEETNSRTEAVERAWIANAHIYVIEDKGVPVSAATLRKDTDGVWEINAVWTDPAHRQKGLSRKILEQILVDAKKMNINVLRLDVNPVQVVAVKLYESLGFKKISTVTDHKMGDGKLYNQEVMEITL